MEIKSKNGKHHTIYINIFLLAFIAPWIITSATTGFDFPVKDKWIIVIDPGHGGKDPGAVGLYSHEKNITLAIALKTGAYLEQNLKNVKVLYTRKSDVFIGLNERSDFANSNKADLFVSIHANANPVRSVFGTETYVMGHSLDKQNLEVAMKENEVMKLEDDYTTKYEGFDPKSPESYIMFTLMQNAFSEQSLDLAARLQGEFKTRVGRYDRGVKQGGFWVLWTTTMPSILTEVGFISNASEERYLNSKQGQDYLASAIYRACKEYIAEIDRKSDVYSPVTEPVVPKPELTETIKPLNDKITFMVQVAASAKRREITPSAFNKLTDVREISDGTRYRYATGSFEKYEDAVSYRKEIESVYPDAFVIAVKNNKILPLQEALNRK